MITSVPFLKSVDDDGRVRRAGPVAGSPRPCSAAPLEARGPAGATRARPATRRRGRGIGGRIALVVALLAPLASGCRQDMHDQPRYEPLEASDFYDDGLASRPLVPGTVARGHLDEDDLLMTGKDGAEWSSRFPFVVTREVMDRGHERFEIFCSPCHGRLGDGLGMVVRRGFPTAQSFHVDRLREEKSGYFFDVITNGFGRMRGYASQIPPRDRWAIVAYIRALQLSQAAPAAELGAADLRHLAAEESE